MNDKKESAVDEGEAAQPETLDLGSLDVAAGKRDELIRLFPEARTEGGKIDFDRLKLALGERVDVGKERYGFTWPGKADCFKTIQAPSVAALRPYPDESVHFDAAENVIIEGDNLEVLKLLQKSYLGKIKMIYIDPPYNSGNDFIYPDNYGESLQTYLEYTGQVDAQGKKFSTNAETDGRFHSKWLNMMYPRLFLARNLLRDNGVIFVSISDLEIQALRAALNDVFGEENWLGTIVWKGATDNNPTRIVIEHEYIVCYARDKASVPAAWTNESAHAKAAMLSEYARLREAAKGNPETIQAAFRKFIKNNAQSLVSLTHYNRVDELGPYTGSRKVHNPKPGGYKYDVKHPGTGRICIPPANGYRFPPQTMEKLLAEGRILFGVDETQIVQIKEYLEDFSEKLSSVLTLDSRAGANEMEALFGDRKVFPHPKPVALVRELASFCLEKSDLILDFFAGSGTTAQAALELNGQDGGSRRFVLVQLPEPTGREDYSTIAEITKERVRRVIGAGDVPSEGQLTLEEKKDIANGFRAFKLAESNFRTWDGAGAQDATRLGEQIELHASHVRDGRTPQDILFEILLKSGFALTTHVETLTLAAKTVFGVSGGAMLVCLDRGLTLELIREMAALKPERVVCLDEGFAGNDQLKTNAVQIFKAKGVVFKTA